jgi:hypothetical protein
LRVKGAYTVALPCGAAPLCAGVAIYLLWLVTSSDALAIAGVFVLFVGCVAFAVGVLALARYVWLAFRAPELPRRFWLSTFGCAALLVSNFPTAGLIVRDVLARKSTFIVVVRNETREPLTGLEVVGPDHLYAVFNAIPAGEAQTRSFRVQREGPLELRSADATTLIDGYVSADQGGLATVTVGPGGATVALQGEDFLD